MVSPWVCRPAPVHLVSLLLAWMKCPTGCSQIASSWTLRRQRFSGVQHHVGRIICHLLLFVSERITCCLRLLSVTWEFTLTAMSECGLMCRVRCRYVLLCYDSCAASDVQCPIRCSTRWSCRWSCHVSTMATQHLLGFPRLSSVDFSQCSTLLPDWYTDLLGTSTSHRCCETFTGCGLLNASTSNWLCSSTDACMVWRHGTFPTTSSSLLILTAAVCGRRHPCSWRSDVHGCPLLATVRFRWPDAAFGTVCHPMSRSLFFGIASRHTSSQDHFLHNF